MIKKKKIKINPQDHVFFFFEKNHKIMFNPGIEFQLISESQTPPWSNN